MYLLPYRHLDIRLIEEIKFPDIRIYIHYFLKKIEVSKKLVPLFFVVVYRMKN